MALASGCASWSISPKEAKLGLVDLSSQKREGIIRAITVDLSSECGSEALFHALRSLPRNGTWREWYLDETKEWLSNTLLEELPGCTQQEVELFFLEFPYEPDESMTWSSAPDPNRLDNPKPPYPDWLQEKNPWRISIFLPIDKTPVGGRIVFVQIDEFHSGSNTSGMKDMLFHVSFPQSGSTAVVRNKVVVADRIIHWRKVVDPEE